MKAKYLLISVLTVISFACQDDWLDIRPLSIYTPESIYIDKAGMDAVMLALRRGLRDEFYGGLDMLISESICTDVGVAGAKNALSTHNFVIQVTPFGTGQNNFFLYWNLAFNQIRNANVIISRIDAPSWKTENEKNEILAEAYFHRAYWYYRLVHQFGDVPFLNHEYTAPKIDFYTHSRHCILNKIQTDLEFSVKWLPEVVDPGKVNRAAGYHLLTKIYLANNQYDKAILSASSVINDGKYSLIEKRFGSVANNNRFNVIWDLHQKENKSASTNTEKILVVQDKYGFPGAEVSQGTQAMYNYVPAWWNANYIRDPNGVRGCVDTKNEPQVIKLGRGNGNLRPSNYYAYEIWTDLNDLRHSSDTNWMPTSKMRYNNPASNYYGKVIDIKYTNPSDTFQAYYPWPQYKTYISDEERPDQPYGGHSDWYVFRLAETYLLRAEAYYWNNDLSKAAADVNVVRLRAKASPISATQLTIEYILDERARELYCEEPRKTELTRIAFIMAENGLNGYSMETFSQKNYWFDRVNGKNGIYKDKYLWGTNPYTIQPYHVLWPIPQDAIDSNVGGRINQNAGYTGSENNIPPKTEITEKD